MADPLPGFYENDSTPLSGAALNDLNPVDFGPLPLGEVSQPQDSKHRPLHLWNDKGGGARKTMETVELALKDSLGGDTGQFIAGTAGNGFVPFYEVRSSGAAGCQDDAETLWSKVGGLIEHLIGDIPAGARRSIWLRCEVPLDATGDLTGLLVVNYTFTP